jgi:hypothetical protein
LWTGCLDSSLKTACRSDADCLNGHACVTGICQANTTAGNDMAVPPDMFDWRVRIDMYEPNQRNVIDMDGCDVVSAYVNRDTNQAIVGCGAVIACDSSEWHLDCNTSTCICMPPNGATARVHPQPVPCTGGPDEPVLSDWRSLCH